MGQPPGPRPGGGLRLSPRNVPGRPPVHPSLRHPCSLVLVVLAVVAALAGTSRAAEMVVPAPYRPKDFTLVRKDGVYHLFYIRNNATLPHDQTEKDFGHAISTDLQTWTQLPPVMAVNPSGWDDQHVWAPHIVESGGLYWMFYTGVSQDPGTYASTQRIGLAVSSDLMTWNRVGTGPVFDLSQTSWGWWDPLEPLMACRDPFVMRDPAAPGRWLMYYTASPASDTASTLVGVARSTGQGLTQWQDLQPLWATHRSNSFNVLNESPHLFQRNGRWFMMVTTSAGQPLSFFVGYDPVGETSPWAYRGRLSGIVGEDTRAWYASEMVRVGALELFAYVMSDRIVIRRMEWYGPEAFILVEPVGYRVRSLAWTASTVVEGQPVGLRMIVRNPQDRDQGLRIIARWPDGGEYQVPFDDSGMDPYPKLTGDTTTVLWYPRHRVIGPDPTAPFTIRISTDDGLYTTEWLSVTPGPISNGGALSGSGRAEDPLAEEPPVGGGTPADSLAAVRPSASGMGSHRARATGPVLRALRSSPLSAGPTLVVEMPAAGHARLDLLDLQGRRVARLADRPLSAGAHAIAWDMRSADGATVAPGLYFARLETSQGRAVARVLVER